MNEARPVVLVNVNRDASGSYVGTCSCGWLADGLAARGAVVEAFVAHCRDEHPHHVNSLMASVFPPQEYCDSPMPAAEFAAMCRRMWELPARKPASRKR